MNGRKIIWALLDERQGNTSQTLGLAEALGWPFETRQIGFNRLIRLPNPLVYHNTLGITEASARSLAPPWPDLVLSTARRLALVASYIKHRHPESFLAQIQWPGLPSRQFDLIAAPIHDGISPRPNLMTTLGAPHRVTMDRLREEAERWREQFAPYPLPRIGMLLGGGPEPQAFADRHGPILARRASALAAAQGGSLLITTSRRTGEAMARALSAQVTAPHYLYAWREGPPDANPFYGILGLSDAVIVTGDSVSMCSEACATGKPVFIYADADFMSRKHALCAQALVDRGYARFLNEGENLLFTPSAMLDEASAIAAEIRKRMRF